jgi:hypothetical protein
VYKCQAEVCVLGDTSPSFEWRKWEAGELADPSTFKRYNGPHGKKWGGLHNCSKCMKFLCLPCGGEFPIVCDQCKGRSSTPDSEDSEEEEPLAGVQVRLQAEKRRAGNSANRIRERAAAMDRNGGTSLIPHKQLVELPEDVEQNVICELCHCVGQDTNGDALLPCKCCELVACR